MCLSTGDNTPPWLLTAASELFRGQGYGVAVNDPYRGCLVPAHHHGDPRVPAIMIEINRRLYLQPVESAACRPGETAGATPEFERVRGAIRTVMLALAARCEAKRDTLHYMR